MHFHMMVTWRGLAGCAVLVPLVACGSGSDTTRSDTGQAPAIAEASIGSEGGTLSTSDGFSIQIPAGALSASTVISVRRYEDQPGLAIGPAYELGPEGLTFSVPAELTMPIATEKAGLPPNMVRDARVYTAPGGTTDYSTLPTVSVSASEVHAKTPHFSIFVPGQAPPQMLSDTEDYPFAFAVDAGYVYWTSGGNAEHVQADGNAGLVMRAPRSGGTAEALTPSLPDPKGIAVDDTYVYFVSGGSGATVEGGPTGAGILRIPKSGGDPETLTDAKYPQVLLLDGDTLYWSDSDLQQVFSMPKSGGDITVIASDLGKIKYMIAAGDALVWSAGDKGTVATAPMAGGEVSVLASGQGAPSGIAIDGDLVYWAATDDHAIRSVSIHGGAVTDVLSVDSPVAIAVGDGMLYYTDAMNSLVAAHSLQGGGDDILLAENQQLPWKLAIGGAGELLWLTAGKADLQGAVARLVRPAE